MSILPHSTLSLIINIVSKQPVGNKVEVMVSYGSYKMFDPYWFQGFAGRLARLQQAKQILDEQVSLLDVKGTGLVKMT